MNNEKKRFKIEFYSIMFFFSAFFLYPPIGLKYLSHSFSVIVNHIQLFVIGLIWLNLIIRKFKISKMAYIIGLYFFILLFSSFIINERSISDVPIKNVLVILSIVILFSLNIKKHYNSIINSYLLYFEIITLLQITCQILYPNGMEVLHGYSQNWILGFKNYPARVLLPGLCFSLLWSYKEKETLFSVRTIIDFIIIGFVILKSESGTGIAGIMFCVILLVMSIRKGLPRYISIKNVMYCTIILFILIYFVSIQNFFAYFIVNILKKDLTFTGRIVVWDLAMDSIKNNFILGVGLRNDYSSILRNIYSYAHSHQYFLHILFTGGIVSLSIIIGLYNMVNKSLKKCGDKKIYTIFTIIISSFLIMGIDESLTNADMMFGILLLAYEIPKLNITNKGEMINER